jgi:Alginate lyase
MRACLLRAVFRSVQTEGTGWAAGLQCRRLRYGTLGSTRHRFAQTGLANLHVLVLFVGLLLVTSFATTSHAAVARTLIWKMENLNLSKQLWLKGDVSVVPAVDRVIYVANQSISRGTDYSITYKTDIPSGLTPHDFYSTGAYWWPNPDTEDGLPWIPMDGVINPDGRKDFKTLESLATDVQALSLSYFFTGDQAYSDWAANLLRVFFLNPDTYMKPEVRYGGMIPGVSPGGFGAAGEGNQFRRLFDPIALLEGSPSWTAADDAGMRQWATDFLGFMQNDPVGLDKLYFLDNHGSNYDMISTLLSLYLEDDAGARQWILNYKDRIDLQFNPDGTQLYPLRRADSQLYHEYNLRVGMDIAEMANRYDDIDLWSYQAEDGGGLVNSIEFLVPYFTGEQPWDLWPTASTFTPNRLTWYWMWLRAADNLDDPTYLRYAEMVRAYHATGYDYDWVNIVYPVKASALLGDLNADGFVGIDDLNIVLVNWNQDVVPGDERSGDLTGEGFVGIDDLNIILANWNEASPPLTSVPEPASVCLLIFGLALTARRPRRDAA